MGPENRTVSSNDFLRVNLIGDFGGYTNIPSFEDFYLVIPRQVYFKNIPMINIHGFQCWKQNVDKTFFFILLVVFYSLYGIAYKEIVVVSFLSRPTVY